MGDRNLVISMSAAILLLLLFFYACSKNMQPPQEGSEYSKPKAAEKPDQIDTLNEFQKLASKGYTSAGSQKARRHEANKYKSRGFGHASSYGSYSGAKTKAQERFDEALKKAVEEAETRQNDILKAKLKAVLSDENADSKVKAHYQLVSNEAYCEASFALRNGDYEHATKQYALMLKDKKCTPVMQYKALSGIKICAAKLGNLELFIATLKQLGHIISTEDLSAVNVEKDDFPLTWALEFEKYMLARKNPAIKARLLAEKIDKFGYTPDFAEKQIEKRTKQFEVLFPEFAL